MAGSGPWFWAGSGTMGFMRGGVLITPWGEGIWGLKRSAGGGEELAPSDTVFADFACFSVAALGSVLKAFFIGTPWVLDTSASSMSPLSRIWCIYEVCGAWFTPIAKYTSRVLIAIVPVST